MMCSKQSNTDLFNWKYVLRQCVNCSKNNVTEYESRCTNITPKIKFYQYVLFSTCSVYRLLGKWRLIYNLCDTEKIIVRYEVEK